MFYCERCGTSFNAAAAPGSMSCPRCRLKDGVVFPLTFTISGAIAKIEGGGPDEVDRVPLPDPPSAA